MKITIKKALKENMLLEADFTYESVVAGLDKKLQKIAKSVIWNIEQAEDFDEIVKIRPWLEPPWKEEGQLVGFEKLAMWFKAAIMEVVPNDISDTQKARVILWLTKIIQRADFTNPGKHVSKDGNKFARVGSEIISMEWEYLEAHRRNQGTWRHIMRQNIETFFQHNRFMSKKELNIKNFPTTNDLLRVVARAEDDIKEYLEKLESANAKIEVLRDDEKWNIAIPHNHSAARTISRPCRCRAKWCTAISEPRWFEQYSKPNDPLFFFMNKKTRACYQFSYGSKDFANLDNYQVDEEKQLQLTMLLGKALGERASEYPHFEQFYKQNKARAEVLDPDASTETLYRIVRQSLSNMDKWGSLEEQKNIFFAIRHENIDSKTLAAIASFYASGQEVFRFEEHDRAFWQDIILAVAKNPKTPEEVLDWLADQQNLKLRKAVAANPAAPRYTLDMLARGGDPSANVARQRISLQEVIRKTGKKFCLYSKSKDKDGKRKKLGCYTTKKAAKKREKQVQYFKHKG